MSACSVKRRILSPHVSHNSGFICIKMHNSFLPRYHQTWTLLQANRPLSLCSVRQINPVQVQLLQALLGIVLTCQTWLGCLAIASFSCCTQERIVRASPIGPTAVCFGILYCLVHFTKACFHANRYIIHFQCNRYKAMFYLKAIGLTCFSVCVCVFCLSAFPRRFLERWHVAMT